jgi:transmembrane sensor
MRFGSRNPDTVEEEADRWALRIRGESLTDAEHAEFLHWLHANALHARAFEQRCTLLAWVCELKSHPEFGHAKWRTNPASDGSRRIARGWLIGVAAAASIAVIATGIAFRYDLSPASHYETHVGEMRVVRLSDGSTATLDTATRMEWKNGEREREVNLVSGQALFDVAHDPAKPFIVHVGKTTIRVTGTRFDVYRYGADDIWLTVVQGVVEVSGPGTSTEAAWRRLIHAREQVVYRSERVITDVHSVTSNRALKWMDHELDVEDESLGDVIHELTRYTAAPIILQDPSLAQIRIAATFDLRDVSGALTQLQSIARVKLVRKGASYVISGPSDIGSQLSPRSTDSQQ